MIHCPAPRTWAAVLLIVARAVATLAGAAQSPQVATIPASHPAFRVYDALLFRNKPDLSKYGLLPARGSGNLWSTHAAQNDVDEVAIRRESAASRDFPGVFYLDIERWRVYNIPDSDIDANITKLARVADIVRQTAPNLQFGFYGVMPEIVYWPLVAGTADQLQRWHESAHRTESLARKVDVIFPSLYTFYTDQAGWEKYARITLTEARRYGKPVYPFLWPEFHDSNKLLTGHAIPADYWRKQLELCRRHADGIVLWGGYERSWDENAEWWQATKSFLATLK